MTDGVQQPGNRTDGDSPADLRVFVLDAGAWADLESILGRPERDLAGRRSVLANATVLTVPA